MLLVDDGQAKVAEHDIILKQSMGSNQDADATVFDALMYLTPLGGLAASGQKSGPYTRRCKQLLDILKVLLCKDFRRCHNAGLVSVSDSDESA